MIRKIKKLLGFNDKQIQKSQESYTPILELFKQHFGGETQGYIEDEQFSKYVLDKIKPNTKTIFIIDDNCFISEMIETELHNRLEKENRTDEFSVIQMCKADVAYNYMTILTKYNIKPDFLLVDIEFGKVERINNANMRLDGVDLAIESTVVNPELKFILFTGNVISSENKKNYKFVGKFENYFGKNILDKIIIKDTVLNFEYGEDIFDIIFKAKK
jgi:hypothetical protein